MSRRFGRNQRRRLREEAAQAHRTARYWQDRESDTRRTLIERYDREIEAARRAKDVIRITVDALMDPRDLNLAVVARFEMPCRGELYAANRISLHDIAKASDIERVAFIKHAGKIIAEHGLQQIMRHWRSR